MRDLLRTLTPDFLLTLYRKYKKEKVRKNLADKAKRGDVITTKVLIDQLKCMGIKQGDSVLVHSAMSRMGCLENGPRTLIDALLDVVGSNGNILMPTSPNPALQLDYVRQHPHFDARNDPSAMGAITEYFRKMPGTIRSLSPTEPVNALGPLAEWLTEGHRGRLTPYDSYSPFFRLTEVRGKILYVGVTLAQAGTSLHLLEDAVEKFPYPVYYFEVFNVKVTDLKGETYQQQIKVHNPAQSAKRQCDALIPMFVEKSVMQRVQLGEAPTLLADAAGMFRVMLEAYMTKGITMYTPYGRD
ncbi:MAG: AAC(3) family N-acetyltransferase [Thermaurantimonas sp.]|uniref:AAC(3) family N-acetyltransferase n=1 Tax=Thermaurantimonas sp. TaxID=2681568 RepID=UPI00391C137B